jgi:hypothetical protein
VDMRITGTRSLEPSRTPASTPPDRPDPEARLLALTVAFVACVVAALVTATQHVTLWPAFLVLALFVLAEMAVACEGR